MVRGLLWWPLWAVGSVMAAGQGPVDRVIDQYFPQYDEASQCWVATTEQGAYCMQMGAHKTVAHARGEAHYVLMYGQRYDFEQQTPSAGHVHSGYVAMFVVDVVGGKATTASAKADITVGAFGHAPKDWTFHQFGPQTYGFLSRHGDMHQGYAGSHYVILVPQGRSIAEHWIGASMNNEGVGLVKRKETVLDSQIKIDRSVPIRSGLYPLLLTVSGWDRGVHYQNQAYRIGYDARKKAYVMPKRYPLRDIDY